MAWVDAAKGMSILLVVLHHVVMFLEPHGLVPPVLSAANVALASLRMPLFFLASGLFAASALAAPWRTVLHKRVAFFLYLYLLWTGVQFVVFLALPPDVAPAESTQSPAELAWTLLVPAPAMWFLYALALFSVLVKLTRRVPGPVQIGLAGVLCAVVGAGLLEFDSCAWTFMARYYLFFLIGCHARGLVQRVANGARVRTVVPAVLVAGAAAGGSVLLDLRSVPGVALLLNIAAVTCGVLLAAQLARWRIGRPVVTLGRYTLPVYLTNVLWVGLAVAVLKGLALSPVLQYVLAPVLTLLVTGLSLLVYRLLRGAGAGWLFGLPSAWAHRPPPVAVGAR